MRAWRSPALEITTVVDQDGSGAPYGNNSTTIDDASVSMGSSLSLASFSAPQLKTVGGGVGVNGNLGLADVTLPALETIEGGLGINGNWVLTDLSLPALTTVGGGVFISCRNFSFISWNCAASLSVRAPSAR